MADSVGQIGLDLVVNKNGFDKQMKGIQSVAKKAAVVLASAFAVKKIIDFGAECIELGSDLQEVQNVVDVTFPSLSKQVDTFAQNAAASFGLSETMAKRFTGTFGSMAKAFGFNEQAAYEMSTALTGLAGDVASFYNISQDEAYTKLKSVFTGETESLKDLGVVMTQTALDSFAMAKGYGKTTAAMSEAEKVALRYAFVQEQLSTASGDFIRTSDGWANQVRVLKLQFDSLKATIGQGLINVLTPVLQLINSLIPKVQALANSFKTLTEELTGKKGESQAAIVAADAQIATGAVGDMNDELKKTGKGTTGIDELNIISDTEGKSSSGSSGADTGVSDTSKELNAGGAAVEEYERKLGGLAGAFNKLTETFQQGFFKVIDTSALDGIKGSLAGIRTEMEGLFLDVDVQAAAGGFVSSIVTVLGASVGNIGTVGSSIASNLFGGIQLYLQQNSPFLKETLVSLFDIRERAGEIQTNLMTALSYVFTVFQTPEAQQITADIIGIFSDAFLGITELSALFGTDVFSLITAPFIENKELIQTTLSDTFSAVEPILSETKEIVDDVFLAIKQIYDESVAPVISSFKEGFTEIAEKLLTVWNEYVLPIVDKFSKKFEEFRENSLNPLIEKFKEFFEKVSEAIISVWENFLKPFVTWFIETMAPVISGVISVLIDTFFLLWDGITKAVGFILDALGGLADFISCVFKGEWEEVFTGIKEFFSDIWDAIIETITTVLDTIGGVLDTALQAIKESWEAVWDGIKRFFSNIWDTLSETVQEKFNGIRDFISEIMTTIRSTISTVLNTIRTKFSNVFTNIKNTVKRIFDGMWGAIKGVINSILGGIEKMANGVVKGINKVIGAMNGFSFDIPDWVPVPGMRGKTFGFNIPKLNEVTIPRLAQGGFVKANTPQLAMIGDNRRYGEVVAPENKLQEMVDKAVAMASGSNLSDQYLAMVIELLKRIIALIEGLDLTVSLDVREIRNKLKELEGRSGYSFT